VSIRTRAAVVAVAFAMLAVACGGAGGGGGDTAKKKVTSKSLPTCPLDALKRAKGKVKVVVWHGWGTTIKATLDSLVKEYNASQDKVEVSAEPEGKSYDEVLKKYNAAIPSKQLPAIIQLEDTSLKAMVDGGTVLPAEACMKADHYDLNQIKPSVRAYYTTGGVFWPGFVGISEPVLYYNKVHFQKAGLDITKPPATLAELRTAAEKLKKAGVSKKPLSLVLNSWFVESWLNGIDVPTVSHDNGRSGIADKATFDTPEAVKLFTFLKKMKDDGLLDPIPNTDGQINQYLALAQQNSSMTIETSSAATTIKKFLEGKLSPADFNAGSVDVSKTSLLPGAGPFPGIKEPGKVRVSGAAMFIVNSSKPEVQAGAWDFLKFMLQKQQVVKFHIGASYLPFIEGAPEDPKVQTFWKNDLAGQMLKTAAGQLDAVDPKAPGPIMGPYLDYKKDLSNALAAVMLNNADPAKALSAAQSKLDGTMKQYAEDNGG